MMLTAWLKQKSVLPSAAAGLYQAAAAQSRHPVFYQDLGVQDSVDGRFDMLCLHIFLIMRCLNGMGVRGRKLAQALFDHLFHAVDDSLREAGAGDMGVPRHVKNMMEAFNGRIQAYEQALASDDFDALSGAISRNVFRMDKEEGLHPGAEALSNYVFNIRDCLSACSQNAFFEGAIRFPSMEAAPEGEETNAQAV